MATEGVNQAEFWDRRADMWDRRADVLAGFSDAYGQPVMDALAPAPGERVLDIGCGPGMTTLDLARRVGPGGSVVGADLSAVMVAAGRRRVHEQGIANVELVTVDAQTGDLGEGFDVVYSRFGVMFFSDPAAAFANIASALRPGGRLGFVVWGPIGDNPWMFVPTAAAAGPLAAELSFPAPGEPGPFSLADPDAARSVLTGAGLVDVQTEARPGERLIFDETADAEIRVLFEVGPLGEAYAAADEAARQAAVDAVVAALGPYRQEAGWRLPGLALQVTARRPATA